MRINCLLKQNASGIKNKAASLLIALRVRLKSIDHTNDTTISKKSIMGNSSHVLNEKSPFFAERKEYNTKSIIATLLYA